MSDLNFKPILKLSPFAYYVTECDLRLFGSEKKPLAISGLVNQIVLNYCKDSETVRRTSEKITEKELENLFRRMGIKLTRSNLISFRNSSQISINKYTYPLD